MPWLAEVLLTWHYLKTFWPWEKQSWFTQSIWSKLTVDQATSFSSRMMMVLKAKLVFGYWYNLTCYGTQFTKTNILNQIYWTRYLPWGLLNQIYQSSKVNQAKYLKCKEPNILNLIFWAKYIQNLIWSRETKSTKKLSKVQSQLELSLAQLSPSFFFIKTFLLSLRYRFQTLKKGK